MAIASLRARGTIETAVERAVAYGNKHKRSERLERAAAFLKRAGWTFFGVERTDSFDRELSYLNSGDTYDLTVCQWDNGELFASTWGDEIETAENEHCAESDEIRCGYCGQFTPLCDEAIAQPAGARHAWRKTACEHCNHLVGG